MSSSSLYRPPYAHPFILTPYYSDWRLPSLHLTFITDTDDQLGDHLILDTSNQLRFQYRRPTTPPKRPVGISPAPTHLTCLLRSPVSPLTARGGPRGSLLPAQHIPRAVSVSACSGEQLPRSAGWCFPGTPGCSGGAGRSGATGSGTAATLSRRHSGVPRPGPSHRERRGGAAARRHTFTACRHRWQRHSRGWSPEAWPLGKR